jgi:hypothetical protein
LSDEINEQIELLEKLQKNFWKNYWQLQINSLY